MPLPKPREGEPQNEFIPRCMGDEEIQAIGDDSEEGQSQRVAVCFSQWRNRNKSFSTFHVKTKIKDITEKGVIIGYANVFDLIDDYGDVITPGAFDRSLAEHEKNNTRVKMLWQHDPTSVIGTYPVLNADDVGLYYEGKFTLDVQKAREAYALARDGALGGMSIGYKVYPDGFSLNEKTGIATLTSVDLWEISPVTFPANRESRIENVKSMMRDKLPSIKEFEEILREVGFSRSQAKGIATHGYRGMLDRREVGTADSREAEKAVLKGIENIFNLQSFKGEKL